MPVNYELNSNGVYGLRNGVYQDALMTIVDDFEDNDIAEYKYNTGSFTTQSTTVKNGSYALECTATSSSHISSFSGLNSYPSQGDTFRFWARAAAVSDFLLLYFGAQSGTGGSSDVPDGYAAYMALGAGELRLRKRDAGSNTSLASTAVSWSADVWYEIEVDWASDGTITVTLYDSSGSQIAQISGTDTTFSSGGITWHASGTKFADYLRVI